MTDRNPEDLRPRASADGLRSWLTLPRGGRVSLVRDRPASAVAGACCDVPRTQLLLAPYFKVLRDSHGASVFAFASGVGG